MFWLLLLLVLEQPVIKTGTARVAATSQAVGRQGHTFLSICTFGSAFL